MSEVSKEAMLKAVELHDVALHHSGEPAVVAIATTLQHLMDERDAWLRRHAEGAAKYITVVERAEKAEAKLRGAQQAWQDMATIAGRAEAELKIARLEQHTDHVYAEAKLAELVRRVDEWYWTAHRGVTGSESLRAILAEFEAEP